MNEEIYVLLEGFSSGSTQPNVVLFGVSVQNKVLKAGGWLVREVVSPGTPLTLVGRDGAMFEVITPEFPDDLGVGLLVLERINGELHK